MNRIRRSALKKWLYGLLAVALLIAAGVAAAQSQELSSEKHAAALLKKHETLTEQLAHNPYRRPLVLDSSETHNAVGLWQRLRCAGFAVQHLQRYL